MLELCLRLHVFNITNKNGSAVPKNDIEGHCFVLFLANIFLVRLTFLRRLAPAVNGKETFNLMG